MKITLYKNCILNDNYNEVFDLTKKTRVIDGVTESYSVFTDYLKSLDSQSIELPNTYYSRDMSFTLRITGDSKFKEALAFNYCKIEVDDLTRYCFITDIELANTVATYYTEEDIWTNYAYDMEIRRGFVSQSRKLAYGTKKVSVYELPFDYQSTAKIQYINAGVTGGNIAIVCQLQIYQLGTAGSKTRRFTKTILLAQDFMHYNEETLKLVHQISSLDITTKEVEQILNKIILNSGNLQVYPAPGWLKWYENLANTYYEINNIKAIPQSILNNIIDYSKIDYSSDDISIYFAENFARNSTTIPSKAITTEASGAEGYIIGIDLTKALNFDNEITPKILKSFTTSIDFKTISFGTRTSQFEVICLNEDRLLSYDIECYSDDYNFNLFLNFQGKYIEITNDFIVEIPFDSVDGSVQAQRRLNRIMETVNGSLEIAGGVAQTYSNIQGLNATSRLQTTKVRKTEWQYTESKRGKLVPESKTTTFKTKPYKRKQGDIPGVVGGISKIAGGILNIAEANAPVYNSNSGTFAQSIGILNASFGLCKAVITPVNKTYVDKMIDEVGYTVYEFTKDNDFIFNNYFNDYNVLLFTDVIIYGKFPGDIKEALEEILLRGFKIWYNAQLEENPNADI